MKYLQRESLKVDMAFRSLPFDVPPKLIAKRQFAVQV